MSHLNYDRCAYVTSEYIKESDREGCFSYCDELGGGLYNSSILYSGRKYVFMELWRNSIL
jgi:hypothetical protein